MIFNSDNSVEDMVLNLNLKSTARDAIAADPGAQDSTEVGGSQVGQYERRQVLVLDKGRRLYTHSSRIKAVILAL